MSDYSIARKRWHILGKYLGMKLISSKEVDNLLQPYTASLLSKRTSTKPDQASVRRFQSFNLFRTTTCDDDKTCSEKEGSKWYTFSCPELNDVKIRVRLLPTSWNVSDLAGFNNTGNVCIWPSEEVLAYYCIKHSDEFKRKSICELGGGMTCLAGLAVAVSSKADEVVLSDGNTTSADNLDSVVKKNTAEFGETKVSARCIKWECALDCHEYKEAFHYILCADCLFFKECVDDLINVLWLMLKPEGTAIIVAPSRSGSFEHFVKLLDSRFVANEISNYDDDVTRVHAENLSSNPDYDLDLHFPRMLILRKIPSA